MAKFEEQLTANHDGTITLAVYQPSGIAQANAKLRQLGDRVVEVPVVNTGGLGGGPNTHAGRR
ncbi:MAG: hypothetical protein ABSA02_16240 [Trebonia sp.]|jgi:hypothetical protein